MSVLDVWNQALGAAKARGRVESLTENSPEREVCEQWYDIAARTVQEAAWWPACKATARLAQLSTFSEPWDDGQPEPGFNYAYALPTNYLRAWNMSDYGRFAIGQSLALNRRIISTNSDPAVLTYAYFNADPAQWENSQTLATVFALAAYISAPLTGQRSAIESNYTLANNLLNEARAINASVMQHNAPKTSVPWLAARNYTAASQARYYYPYGALFSAGAVSGA